MQLFPKFPFLDLIVSHVVNIAHGGNSILHVQSPQGLLFPFLDNGGTTFEHYVYSGQDITVELHPSMNGSAFLV